MPCSRFSVISALFLLLFVVQPELAAEEEKSEGIVVWRLEKKSGVSDNDIDSISGIITAEVERNSGRKVVSEADIQTILIGEEKKQKCGGGDASCIAEIGAALGVPEIISGDLGRVGTIWVLNLRRINIRGAEVIKRASRQIDGTISDLVRIISEEVEELFELEHAGEALSPYKVGAYASFFSGVGLGAFGFVGMWQMKEAKDSGDKSAHEAWKGVTITSWTIGGAAMATGIVLWVLDFNAKEKQPEVKEDEEETDEISYGVVPQKDGLAVNLLWRW